jgi:large subunit ribosomal protein L17
MKKSKDLPLLRNLIYSLVLFGKIKTTRARAKATVGLVDRIVNKIKKGTVAGRRQVLTFLPQKPVVEKLMKEIIPKLAGRSSGYTRIIKIGERAGDGAPMVVMEWVVEKEQPKVESVTDEKVATQKAQRRKSATVSVPSGVKRK